MKSPKTLFEAIVLVILVIFVFLQNWRALLVPAIAIPVVLLGTFAVFYIAGFTINTMTLFGLTLAVGLLVDDAIVVVENVERLLHENPGMTPKEATIKSMAEIQVALIAIAMSLSAVFLPMAFFGGSTGVIYKQFSLTIVSAMVLSVFVALIFSPALTSTMLRQRREDTAGEPTWLDRRAPVVGHTIHRARTWFNTGFEQLVVRYRETIVRVIDRKWLMLGIYALVCLVLVVMFLRLPTGFCRPKIRAQPRSSSGFRPALPRTAPKRFNGRSKAISRNTTPKISKPCSPSRVEAAAAERAARTPARDS